MAKRGSALHRRSSQGRSPALFIVCTEPPSALLSALFKTFAQTRLVSALSPTFLRPRPKLAIRGRRADEPLTELSPAQERLGSIPTLAVYEAQNEVIIGPLSVPGRPGCDWCAHQRLRAAAPEGQLDIRPAESRQWPQKTVADATDLLKREIRTILRRGAMASRLLGRVLILNCQTGTTSLHRFIPLPRCPVCGGAAVGSRPRRVVARRSQVAPENAVDQILDGWVDRRTGIIPGLFVEPTDKNGMDLPVVVTAAPPHVIEAGVRRRMPIGWGKGLTLADAVLSAVGEALERYSASLPDLEEIHWARVSELKGDFLDPAAIPLYSEEQYQRERFGFARWDPHVVTPWVRGHWLATRRPVWVPAIFAFLSLTLRPEQLICQGTSNGLAAGFSFEDAAKRATLELVERDALMTSWITACPAQRVIFDATAEPELRRIINGLETFGATVELYLLRTGACGATALCLGLGDGETYPAITLGLGADLNPYAALRQAVLELGQTGPHLRRLMRSGALAVPADAPAVREMLDHASYYFPLERAAVFDRLRSQESPMPLSRSTGNGGAATLRECVSALGKAGIRVALIDVTSPDVATGPFHVVRAVSPDLQPISYGYGLDRQCVGRIVSRGLAYPLPAVHPIW